MKPDNRSAAVRLNEHGFGRISGWILVRYAEIEGLDDLQVAEQWGCPLKAGPGFNLCLRPRPSIFSRM